MAHAAARGILWLFASGLLCLSGTPLAAQERYIRLDDGLYELNADGTYHKVERPTANTPRPSSAPSRPATNPASGPYTGQERFMRFDDGLYERMADGTYTKVDERRLTQSQSQPGRYGASSTSMDPRWQQQYGGREQWDNQPEQWNYNGPQQWSNNNWPQQWNNNRPQQWSNNNRPQQWNNNRPSAIDPMLMNSTGQDQKAYAPNPMGRPGQRPSRPSAVDPMLMNSTGQGVSERAQGDPWYELGRSIRGVIEAEAQRGRSGR